MNFRDEFEKGNDQPNATEESSEVTDTKIEEYETLTSSDVTGEGCGDINIRNLCK